MDRIPAKRIFKTPAGDTVIDFAQNMAGRIEVTAAGKPGDVIEIYFGTREVKAEVLKLEDTTKKEKAEELFRYL